MALLIDLRRGAARPSWGWTGRLAAASFLAQTLGSWVVWIVVDDWSGRGWSNADFREWVGLSIALAVLLAVLGGTSVRRWWVTWAVAAGCMLSVALGCAAFYGYAVMNSA